MLTCEGLDARALKEAGGAVVVVQLLVQQVEAGVDVAVLLRDLRIVEVRGGSHGGGQRGGRGRGRRWASSLSEEMSLVARGGGANIAGRRAAPEGGLGRQDSRGIRFERARCWKGFSLFVLSELL